MHYKKGILLINLGTPLAPTTQAVRSYLREFLMDPYVINLPWLIRAILVYGFILPTRPKQSTAAYQSIWTPKGSPLLIYSEAFQKALQKVLGSDYLVTLGMRYGQPRIKDAVQTLTDNQCETVTVLPLFPQYASAVTDSAIEQARKYLKAATSPVHIIKDFFHYEGFIQSQAKVIKEAIKEKPVEHWIFSYHGLPARQLTKEICKRPCKQQACPPLSPENRECYRAQCYETSRLIAQALQLSDDSYNVSFQSRLGKTEWIKPYTDLCLITLRKKGIKNIAVVCPSFVVDCLETLEEIGIRLRTQWQQLGGEQLYLMPCVNADPVWVAAIASKLRI